MTDSVQTEALPHLAGYIEQLGIPATKADAIAERDAWVESAAQFSRNEDYYRGLLDKIAEALGAEAYTADDGSIYDSPVRAKLPDLVKERLAALSPPADDASFVRVPRIATEAMLLAAAMAGEGPLSDYWFQRQWEAAVDAAPKAADDAGVERLREALEKATAGVWSWEDGPPTVYSGRADDRGTFPGTTIPIRFHGYNLFGRLNDLSWNGRADLDFAVACVNHVRAALT